MRIASFLAVLCALWGLVGCSKTDQFVMPDLAGKYWVDAEPELRALGWTGTLVLGAEVDRGIANHNRIVSQKPSAGSETNNAAEITLQFGS
jgi:beta-lactam-binding protein with PASTA domain